MRIEKQYFTLPEILERWSISEADLVYLAENDALRLSVRVFRLPIELGDYDETADGQRHRIPYEFRQHSGLLDLHTHDVFELYRNGVVHLRNFRTQDADYATLRPDLQPITVRVGDLLVRRDERDRVEAEPGFADGNGAFTEHGFAVLNDYQEVRCNGHVFRLGPIQAQVIRALHAATLCGDPWQNGKAILQAAGSRSLKMSDVFKSQKDWRHLIRSNRRGAYALNAD